MQALKYAGIVLLARIMQWTPSRTATGSVRTDVSPQIAEGVRAKPRRMAGLWREVTSGRCW